MVYFTGTMLLEVKSYPWMYYTKIRAKDFPTEPKVGDMLDVIKVDSAIRKASWSRGFLK